MERVQFQQEQMLAELKDLVERGIFTQKEVKQIMQKRTAFETALVRRAPKKGDFLRYITYEMGLEDLRKKRVHQLKQRNTPPSISDYALVRRQFHIFERALKKFKGDVGLWIQYTQVAQKEGARALVGRITARALQLHPSVPSLYILAAQHELSHGSPGAARSLLQRGLRLNSDSVDMWREYVRLEMNFLESMRRRWNVLGIKLDESGTTKGSVKGKEREILDEAGAEDNQDIMQVDEEDDGEEARRAIMEGALVKSAIASAVKVLASDELFKSIHALLSTYPCQPSLRTSLLLYLHDILLETRPDDPDALKLAISWELESADGETLVERLQAANERLIKSVKESGGEKAADVYAAFVEEWYGKDLDEHLKTYLIASLKSLIKSHPSPSLLSTHISLLISSSTQSDDILHQARKYTKRLPSSSRVWLARLRAERELPGGNAETAWEDARANVKDDKIIDVWLWGLDNGNGTDVAADTHGDLQRRKTLLEHLLQDGARIPDPTAWGKVQEELLLRYAQTTNALLVPSNDQDRAAQRPQADRVERIRRLEARYTPSARVWSEVFKQEVEADDEKAVQSTYQAWKKQDGVEATLAWAGWLLKKGKGKAAMEIINNFTISGNEESKEVERRWTLLLDGANED